MIHQCPNLNPYILRPGLIYNKEHRGWSVPLSNIAELAWCLNENVAKKLPFGPQIDFLFPDKPTKLEAVGHFAIEGVLGNLDPETHQIVSPEMFIE